MSDIASFIKARLAEDAEQARWLSDDWWLDVYQQETADAVRHFAEGDRVQAGIDAKRQLVDAHERTTEMWDQGNGLVDVELCRTCAYGESCDHCFERDDLPDVGWPCRPLRLLASEFAAHQDYRPEWRMP